MTREHLLIAVLVTAIQVNSIGAEDDTLTMKERWFNRYRLPDVKPEDVWIDAFDEKICGASEFRSWRSSRSEFEFRCADDPERSIDGLQEQVNDVASNFANRKDFSFYVNLRVNETSPRYKDQSHEYCLQDRSSPIACNVSSELDRSRLPFNGECLGLLVDKNLVITLHKCLDAKIDSIELSFVRNSARMGDPISDTIVTRRAKKWCWRHHSIYSYESRSSLAAIELDEPIDYVEDKIRPICLNPRQGKHLNQTTCLYPKECPEKLPKLVASVLHQGYQPIGDLHHSVRPESRSECHVCGPIVCYNKCPKNERDRVQGLAFGITWLYDEEAVHLKKAHEDLLNLLLMVKKGEKRPFKDRMCSVASTDDVDGNKSVNQ